MKFAAIADVHANYLALEAVLNDIDAQGISGIVNLGDAASGPLDAARTIDLLVDCNAVSIRGNHDRYLIEREPDKMGSWDRPAYDQLEGRHLAWLRGLPPTRIYRDSIFMCHGTPASDETCRLETVLPDGQVRLASAEAIAHAAQGIGHQLILCGHTRLSRRASVSACDRSRNAGRLLRHSRAQCGSVAGHVQAGALRSWRHGATGARESAGGLGERTGDGPVAIVVMRIPKMGSRIRPQNRRGMSDVRKAIIIGVGPDRGLGAQLCTRFAAEGLKVYVAGRTQSALDAAVAGIKSSGGEAVSVVADATSEADVVSLFDQAGEGLELAIYNAGNNTPRRIIDMEASYFERSWRSVCFGGFLFGREAVRRMIPSGGGSLLFTGASASLRGRSGFGAFNSSKAGLRILAQAMAKEYAADGIHVGHVVVDGGIAGEKISRRVADFSSRLKRGQLIGIEGIVEAFAFLHKQPRNAWSFELDVRTSKESW